MPSPSEPGRAESRRRITRNAVDRLNAWATALRRWLQPPRRLHVLRPGAYLLMGVLGLGLATLNTGNNLLYLLLGALLGLIMLSGWLSEESLRHVRVLRRLPRTATAGRPARVEYRLRRYGGGTPAFALEIGEAQWPERAFVTMLETGAAADVRVERIFEGRGIVTFQRIAVATSFPFGLFSKSRHFDAPASLVVWPRADLPVRAPRTAGSVGTRREAVAGSRASATRAEFRGLRPYRPGDDPRDVHWRASARAGEPVVREHEHAAGAAWWLCLDARGVNGGLREEQAVEIAASLAVRALREGERVGLAAAGERLPPAAGHAQLQRILDALATVEFDEGAPAPAPPSRADGCVLVSARPATGHAFADMFCPDDA